MKETILMKKEECKEGTLIVKKCIGNIKNIGNINEDEFDICEIIEIRNGSLIENSIRVRDSFGKEYWTVPAMWVKVTTEVIDSYMIKIHEEVNHRFVMYKLAKERENRLMLLREIYEKKNNS